MTVKLGPREQFIEQNLGLAHACAGRFRGRGIEYDDLYSAGCVGLVKAYDGFDDSRGLCFSTYAVPVILGEIRKLFRDGGTVKVSRSTKELGLKINACRERFLKTQGCEPTVSQLAQQLNAKPEQIALAIRAGQPALSLTPAGEEEDAREWDIPVDSPEEELADRIGLAEAMQALPERDRHSARHDPGADFATREKTSERTARNAAAGVRDSEEKNFPLRGSCRTE